MPTKRTLVYGTITLVVISYFSLLSPTKLYAALLQNRSDFVTTLTENSFSSHSLAFTLNTGTTLDAGESISIDFNEDSGAFNVDGLNDTITDYSFDDGTIRTIVSIDGDCTGFNGANHIVVSTDDTTGMIVFTACSNFDPSPAGATLSINIGSAAGGTNRITNPTAGTYQISITGPNGDTGDIAYEIIPNDQIVVTSDVNEALSFTINDTSIGFGVLSPTQARFATGNGSGNNTEVEAHTISVGTNATNGYSLTVDGATLTSGAFSIDPIGATNTSSNPGAEQFGLRVTASGGGQVRAKYADGGFALDTANFPDEIAYSNTASANTTYSVRYIANISPSTEPAIYATSLTFIASGSF